MARRVTPQEAFNLMLHDGHTYIDVRTESEYEQGHPDGSLNIPLMLRGGLGMNPNPHFLPVVESLFQKDTALVVGCQAGNRSARAVQMMEQAGFTNVCDQGAGWAGVRDSSGKTTQAGWREAGLPVEEGQPERRSWASLRGGQ